MLPIYSMYSKLSLVAMYLSNPNKKTNKSSPILLFMTVMAPIIDQNIFDQQLYEQQYQKKLNIIIRKK